MVYMDGLNQAAVSAGCCWAKFTPKAFCAAAVVSLHSHVEAELGDRGRDLRDLLVQVRARVGGVGQHPIDRDVLDPEIRPHRREPVCYA
jgi:hypothetical protein